MKTTEYSQLPPPCEENAPYVFISYCHSDLSLVAPVIRWLSDHGYRVWYDQGIHPGDEWPEVIADHLQRCTVFMPFISNRFMKSPNCLRELHYAVSKDKIFLSVLCGDVALTSGVEMQIGISRALHMEEAADKTFFESLKTSDSLRCCLSNAGVAEETPPLTSGKTQGRAGRPRKRPKKNTWIIPFLLAVAVVSVTMAFFLRAGEDIPAARPTISPTASTAVTQTPSPTEKRTNPEEDLDTIREQAYRYLYSENDPAAALPYLEKGAAMGSPDMMCELGAVYYYGKTGTTDYARAYELFAGAYGAGYPLAAQYLGDFWYYGTAVSPDYGTARAFYTAAAENDCEWAMVHLGEIYWYGLGVEKNTATATAWLELAAAHNNQTAMNLLAEIYAWSGAQETGTPENNPGEAGSVDPYAESGEIPTQETETPADNPDVTELEDAFAESGGNQSAETETPDSDIGAAELADPNTENVEVPPQETETAKAKTAEITA